MSATVMSVAMMFEKKNLVRTFVCMELMVYAAFYYYGHQGMRHIERMKRANGEATQRVSDLRSEILAYEHELELWNMFSFYKEKIAREQLQMARRTDIIYYLTSTRSVQ